jgi:hypothetical protein
VRDTRVADPAFMRAELPALLDKRFVATLAGRQRHRLSHRGRLLLSDRAQRLCEAANPSCTVPAFYCSV